MIVDGLDCDSLSGRLKEICEGTSGLPPEDEKALRKAWLKRHPFAPVPRDIGLGDVIAWVTYKLAHGDEKKLTAIGIRIDKFLEWISRGRFQAKTDGTCNCDARQIWLNQHFPLWPIR